VSKAALFGVLPPFLLQADDNPKGVPGFVFEDTKRAIVTDRYADFETFFANFYNTDVFAPERIGEAALRRASTSPRSRTVRDIRLCRYVADRFPRRRGKIDAPTLVVHGTAKLTTRV
jgi:pimeloyl-ACP methyl ester carboxylesterase